MAIPFFSIDFGRHEWKAYIGAVARGHACNGDAIGSLQKVLEARFPSRHVTLLPAARVGFALLLEALFKEGDEVIVPAMGFPLYIVLLLRRGIKPVFVDVEPDYYTMDPEKIRAAVTPRTKGVLVTHLFGHPCRMDQLLSECNERGLPVIEDCAHSYGSFFRDKETGNFGKASLFSFSVMKVPSTLGGGALLTDDRELHEKIQARLRQPEFNASFGKGMRYFAFNLVSIMNSYPGVYSILSHQVFGLIKKRNPALLRKILYSGMGLERHFSLWERPRLSNYQAAVGLVQLKRASQMASRRATHSQALDAALAGTDNLEIPRLHDPDRRWNFQFYVVRVLNGLAQAVHGEMFRKGIHLMQENVWDCTRYPFAKEGAGRCPVASTHTPDLIRIQNSSILSSRTVIRIGIKLRESVGWMSRMSK